MRKPLLVLAAAASAAAASATSWWQVRTLGHQQSPVVTEHEPVPRIPGTQQVVLVVNPAKSGAGTSRKLVERACANAGCQPPLVLETTRADPGTGQGLRALASGADVVIAAGGDGTVRAVAEALAHSTAALGVIPLGTGNLLARNLRLPYQDLAACVQTAMHGAERIIDVGRVEFDDGVGALPDSRVFLVMGGIGLDAEVVAATRDGLKRTFGWLAYGEAGMRTLPGRRQRMSISLDAGAPQARKVRSILFANCGRLPAGIDFIPGSTLDDGYLDIVVISPRSLLGWLWVAAKVLLRNSRPIPVIRFYRVREARISVAQRIPTQLDGDPSGSFTSLTVRVDAAALRVRVPEATAPGPTALPGNFSNKRPPPSSREPADGGP